MPRGGARPGAGRPRKVKPTDAAPPVPPPAAAEPERYETPLEFLMSLVNDPTLERRERIQAAVAAAPYVHQKKADAGKKEGRREAAAGVAGSGRFRTSAPPKLSRVV